MEGMSIKEAAKELHVEAHVLRYWEDELKLEIKRNSMGHRYYDERDIRMFQEVQELKTKGFALKDIRMGIEKQKKAVQGELRTENADRQEPTGSPEQEGKREQVRESERQISEQGQKSEPLPQADESEQEPVSRREKNAEDAEQRGQVISEDVKVVDFKLAQMQTTMNRIVANALRENKDIITSALKSEITTDVMRQFDTVMRERAEWEEERFRKLDTLLRQIQQSNAEVAAAREKRRFGRKKF